MKTVQQGTTFKEGDRVRLEGAEKFKGIVITADLAGHAPYRVRWDNGRTGICKAEDLELVTQPVRQ